MIPSLSRYSTLLNMEKCVENNKRGKDGEKVVKIPSLSRYYKLPHIEDHREE